MKATTWSAAIAVGFTSFAAIHCNIARALTYEETACVAQLYSEGLDTSKCLQAGGDGGSAGSGGSGGASGGASGPDGGGSGHTSTENLCVAPSFWFTGPPNPARIVYADVVFSSGLKSTTHAFEQQVDGTTYQYIRTRDEPPGGTAITTWEQIPLDGSASLSHKCW